MIGKLMLEDGSVFAGELLSGAPNPDHEILAVDFFAQDALPVLSGNRTTPAQVAECFAHQADPARPTAFD